MIAVKNITELTETISRWSDSMSFVKKKNGDLHSDLMAQGVVFLPVDNIEKGEFGFYVCKTNDSKDQSFLLSMNVYAEPEEIRHDDFVAFKDVLDKSVDHDFPVFICHDPMTLRLGFIVLKGSGNERHTVRLSAYKRWQSERK